VSKILSLAGQKFSYITFIEKSNITQTGGRSVWKAICDCGSILYVVPYGVKNGRLKSCGCKRGTTAKDWTGKKFHSLTFIKTNGRTVGTKIKWQALCDCGNYTNVVPHQVTCGKTKTCGKCFSSSRRDWANHRSGLLVFLESHHAYSHGRMIWKAKCDCGAICYSVPGRKAESCGCIGREKMKRECSILGKGARKYTPLDSLTRKVWYRYKSDSDLTFEKFKELIKLHCHYCGIGPSNVYTVKDVTLTYNGLDRVDSSKDHSACNVVPCCKDCNLAKREKSPKQLIAHARRITEHQTKISLM
jgi:hypothetical protein